MGLDIFKYRVLTPSDPTPFEREPDYITLGSPTSDYHGRNFSFQEIFSKFSTYAEEYSQKIILWDQTLRAKKLKPENWQWAGENHGGGEESVYLFESVFVPHVTRKIKESELILDTETWKRIRVKVQEYQRKGMISRFYEEVLKDFEGSTDMDYFCSRRYISTNKELEALKKYVDQEYPIEGGLQDWTIKEGSEFVYFDW